jgi:hypothetical protein
MKTIKLWLQPHKKTAHICQAVTPLPVSLSERTVEAPHKLDKFTSRHGS